MKNFVVKTSLGKISLILALANVLFFVFSAVTVWNLESATVLFICTFLSVILTLAGIITGVFGVFDKRNWIGLVLNILFGIFIYLIIRAIFFPPIRY